MTPDVKIDPPWLSSPEKASKSPYGMLHMTLFQDVWPHYGAAFGIDHLIFEDGTVECRIQGKLETDV